MLEESRAEKWKKAKETSTGVSFGRKNKCVDTAWVPMGAPGDRWGAWGHEEEDRCISHTALVEGRGSPCGSRN